jgi:hypothetical protein
MATKNSKGRRGWFKDSARHAAAGRKGGLARGRNRNRNNSENNENITE